jgi:hypothetical protein
VEWVRHGMGGDLPYSAFLAANSDNCSTLQIRTSIMPPTLEPCRNEEKTRAQLSQPGAAR